MCVLEVNKQTLRKVSQTAHFNENRANTQSSESTDKTRGECEWNGLFFSFLFIAPSRAMLIYVNYTFR